ncbi:GNAT family N-acetyltransferase [bacterium]|nr:GNAT family N-acetyltransferase [bacterium]
MVFFKKYNLVGAKKCDTEDVYRVINTANEWLLSRGMDQWQDYYTKELVRSNIINKEVLLVTQKVEPVATVTISTNPPNYYLAENNPENFDYSSLFINPTKQALYISALAVIPKFQGKGIAKELVKIIEQKAKESQINFIRLDARGDYKELINFYLKLGFIKVGELPEPDTSYFLMEKTF